MYEKLKKGGRDRKDTSLRNVIVICVIFFVLATGTIIWIAGYFSRYQRFLERFSASTVYAYDNRCLRAEVEGQSLWVNLKNNYGIYTHITVYGIGSEKYSVPKQSADVTLDYGNGSRLLLWDMEPSGDSRAHRLFLHYEDAEGYRYSYVSDEMDLETIKIQYLLVKTNRKWEE